MLQQAAKLHYQPCEVLEGELEASSVLHRGYSTVLLIYKQKCSWQALWQNKACTLPAFIFRLNKVQNQMHLEKKKRIFQVWLHFRVLGYFSTW